MSILTPIETAYAGCLFRSRLEARWAVFFDTLKLNWSYEPEGYVLRHGEWYLSDFYIEKIGHLEIKPTRELARQESGWRRLGDALHVFNQSAYCLYGNIPAPEMWYEAKGLSIGGLGDNDSVGAWYAPDAEAVYWWALCPHCGQIGIAYEAEYPRLRCCEQARNDPDRSWNAAVSKFVVAAIAARSARF